MEEDDEIEAQTCNKFPRVGNGRNETSNKVGSSRGGSEQYQEEEEDGEVARRGAGVAVGGGGSDGSTNHFQSSWHHSSRIIRVSRASGGKDRHSKVMTSKGLRDRRVRLSVTTAIQFYDLQDRLGYDQPSKAVEWLIKAAQDAISELPSLNTPFPDTPKQLSDEKRPSGQRTGQQQQGFDDADEDNISYQQNQSQNLSLSKSACSSTSETSKGSGLSLSRSEIRVNREKARERARERAAKDKDKDNSKENESNIAASHHHHPHNVNNHNHNHMSHTASFTELLTGGIGSTVNPTTPNGSSLHHIHHHQHQHHDEANLFNKGGATTRQQHWSSTVTPMDYFTSGLLVGPSPSSARTTTQQQHQHQHQSSSSGFQLGHALPISPFSGENVNHSDQMQHFSFMPDHLSNMHHHQTVVTSSSAVVSASHSSGGDNNLNFSISSSGLGGYNRGTLQSNSPSFLPHLHQRFQPLDGSSNLPLFIGAPPAPNSSASAAPNMDNNNNNNHHHLQFSPVFDGRLQLCYGDGTRHSDHKGKGKN